MALLGYQLVITLVMVSVIQKLGRHFSFAKWLICSTGLTRFLYPTDDELRTLAGIPKEKTKGKKDRRYHENGLSSSVFHVPRNLEFQMETTQVSFLDVIHLRYYSDYQMLLDFSLYSLIVYTLTEIYSYFMPLKDEINLSMVWCFLVILFSMKILLTLTFQYFTGEQSIGERSTVIVTFFAYLVLAMAILLIDEKNLETGLEQAYASFNSSAHAFLERHGLNSEGPASKFILKFCIALWCALIGALFTFPGLRMAKMHWDALKYCKERHVVSFFLHINFATPFLLVLLWLRSVTKHYLTVRIFQGMETPILTERAFDSLRLVLIIVAVIIRLGLMPLYLQAYLNIADMRVQEQRKEAGRITNKDLQKKIAAVFYYMCVVALQYLAPLLLCLFFTLMFKTLGEYQWSSIFDQTNTSDQECPVDGAPRVGMPLAEEDSVLRSAQEITLAIDSLKQVLTRDVARGVFGFATWWLCFAWFASSSLGLLYQSYFTHS
ncbi:transmembrane protein 161B [Cimex lectularius]|uniref:Transmembrane protein 161B n=1 Tax=Cimex lectularius TaxID=79782 RepID=A0A8I6RHX5_CIMLE|nr:transmembrane protein 161B [Cimex lectularius]